MEYLLRSINKQLDFGFGITGESYYDAAQKLKKNQGESFMLEIVDLPINFCYRHSIELFLKSLIIIFHNKLNLRYCDTSLPTSKKPVFLVAGKQRVLYSSHNLDDLYSYWKDFLLLPYTEKIKDIVGRDQDVQGEEWEEDPDITSAVKIISTYDKKSSFFRYPVTENRNGDLEKYSMREVSRDTLQNIFQSNKKEKDNEQNKTTKGRITLIEVEDDIIKNVYSNNDTALSEINEALEKVAEYFYCFHIMTRVELCDGK